MSLSTDIALKFHKKRMRKKDATKAAVNKHSGNTPTAKLATIEELEPRILFSADNSLQILTNKNPGIDEVIVEAVAVQNNALVQKVTQTQHAVSDNETKDRVEIVFIDTATPNQDVLLADLQAQYGNRDFNVVMLDSSRDGITQISETLTNFNNIDAIHILSHGDDGEITLGATTLSPENLASYQSSILGWQQALSNDADILIYGCNIAESDIGKNFIKQLAWLTDADVAASDDLTGATALGGDWDLEFQSGNIESSVALSSQGQQQFNAILPNSTPVNNGPFSSWSKNVLPGNEDDGAHDVYSADIDGDGDIDIAAVSDSDDGVIWYENNGSGGFTEHLLSNTEDGAISIRVEDIDGDGDQDLITAAKNSDTVAWWRNDGSENFTRIVVSNSVDIANWVYSSDLDGDGDIDILASESGPSGNLLWFENNGSEVFTQHIVGGSFSSNTDHNIEGISVKDIDGDGDMDITAAFPNDNDVVWFENNGSESFTKRIVDSGASGVREVISQDIDGDGDNDLIAAINGSDQIAWYENDGSENFSKHIVTSSTLDAQTVEVVDIDGDGHLDILVASSGDNDVTWFRNNGSESFTQIIVDSSLSYPEGTATGDFDGDGDLDIAAAAGSGDEFVWYENTYQQVATNDTLIFSAANGNLISISDSDAGSRILTVDISVNSGQLTLSGTNGLTFSTGDGSDDAHIVLSGTLSNINAALNGLSYTSNNNLLSADTLSITTTDPGTGGGPDGPQSDSDSFTITRSPGSIVVVTTGTDVNDGDTSSITALLNNMGGDGKISLREAILATNATANGAGPDTILFNIAQADSSYHAGSNSWQLTPAALPTITDTVVLDALSQGNGSNIRISLIGTNPGASAYGLTSNASDTVIRGFNIQGFSGAGIRLSGGANQVIEANYLGTDISGTIAAANGIGIEVMTGANSSTIGSFAAGKGNLISGNTTRGILLQNSNSATVINNLIGTDITGNADLGNGGYGIEIRNSSNNTIGTTTANRNIISGNDQGGISISFASISNTVAGNYIGTNYAGTSAVGNNNDGIVISDGASNNTIGGNRNIGEGNVLSGNLNDGIEIEDSGTSGNQLYGNYIGVDSSGNFALGNGRHGVVIYDGAASTLVGGAGTGHSNVISSNNISGIVIDGWNNAATANNIITHNYIGTNSATTNDLGNGNSGIQIFGLANNNRIGGLSAGEGNYIVHSGDDGLEIYGSTTNNSVLGNHIYDNANMGIDIGTSGVTANDPLDADVGANDLQNKAVLDFARIVGGFTQIQGNLDAAPNSNYIIEFFHSPPSDADASGGEARNSLGYITLTTNASGNAFINAIPTAIADGNIVTAIITEDLGGGNYGSSSEFAANVVASTNTPPVLSNGAASGLNLAYTEDSVATPFSSASVNDSDGGDLNGGTLSVSFTSGSGLGDQVGVFSSDVTMIGSTVDVNGTAVGTFTGGTGGTPLLITFNSNATVARVDSVYKAILISTSSDNPTAGQRELSVTLSDGDGGTSNTATGYATLTAVNDAPVLDNSGNMTLTTIDEDNTSNNGNSVAEIIASAGGNRITDVDSPNEGIAITSSFHTSSSAGKWQFSDDAGASWQDVAGVSDSTALLLRDTDRLRFLPDTVNGDSGVILFKAWDQSTGIAGTQADTSASTAFSSSTEEANISITSINDLPNATNISSGETYLLDTPLNLTDVTVSDVDDFLSVTVSFTLSDPAAGSLNTATSGFVTSTYNAGTGVWTAVGMIPDINVLLAGLTFTPSSGYNSDFNILTNVFDGDASINGNKSIQFDSAPSASNTNSNQTGTEDSNLNITPIVVNEDNGTVSVTLQLSDAAVGTLNTATSGAVTSTYNVGTGVWIASGVVTDVNTLLAGLTFTPVANYNGSFTLTSSIDDGVNSIVAGSKTITINAVNDAPVLSNPTSPTFTTITENDLTNVGNSVAEIINSASGDQITDVDGGSEGIAVISAPNTVTTWQYSLDSGATWTNVGSVSTSNALLLRDTDRLRAVPNGDSGGTQILQYVAWDQTTDTVGDKVSVVTRGAATAFSSLIANASITISEVPDAPTHNNLNSSETYIEDLALNLTDIIVNDVDSNILTVTLTLSDINAGALNTATSGSVTSTYNAATGIWIANGAIANVNTLLAGLTFTPSANYDSNFTISTQIDDGSSPVINGSKAFTATAINDAPTATNLSAPENYIEDTALNLTDIVVNDVDNTSTTVTLTLTNSNAGSLNTATAGGVTSVYNAATGVWTASGATADVNTLLAGLTFTPAANFNANFSINTSVSDGLAPAVTGSKAMTASAVNDAPNATNLSAPETYIEDTPLNLTNIIISDVDNVTSSVTLTLSDVNAGTLNTATAGGVTSSFNAATGVWSASGATSDVNALLAGLTFTPTASYANNFSITSSVSDGIAPALTGNKIMSATAVNDAPTATGLNNAETVTEDTPLNLSDIVVSDIDNSNTTVTLTLSDINAGALSTATSGGVTSGFNAASGVWTASGAIADVNTLLAGLIFTPALNYDSDFSIATSVNDGTDAISGNKAVTMIAVNDAPSGTSLNAPETYTEDIALNLTDIIISDVDDTHLIVRLTLSDPGAGSLTTGSSGPVNAVYNAATGIWAASGPIGDVNALLAGVSFTPSSNYNGSFTIASSVYDGEFNTTGLKAITAIAVDDPPTATNLSANETYNEDSPLALTPIVIADVDSAVVTATFTLSDAAAGAISTATAGSVTSTFNASTGVWQATGNTNDVNILLAGLVFTPATNYDSDFTLTTQVHDGNASLNASKAFSAIASNDAPVLDNSATMQLNSITEDQLNNNGNSIAEIIASAGGNRITDIDGPAEGIAISATNGIGGAWQYSDDGGNNWYAVGTVSDSSALLLRDNDRIRFVPDGNNATTAQFEFLAWDQSTGIAGTTADTNSGSSAFSAEKEQANIVVTAVNDAPTVLGINSNESYTEDTVLNLSALHINDVDDSNAFVTLTLSNPSAGVLNADSAGVVTANYDATTGTWTASGPINDLNILLADLTFTPANNSALNLVINVVVSDGSAATNGSKNLTAIAVNDAPQAFNDQATVNEGGSTRIILLNNDVDIDSNLTLASISITSTPTHGSITVNADGSVNYQHDGSENFTDSFTYTIEDSNGLSSNIATVALIITPVNDNAPTTNNRQYELNRGDSIDGSSLIDSANDIDNNTLTVIIIAGPQYGELNLQDDGSFTYTPNQTFSGDDGFSYVLSDGVHTSDIAHVSFKVLFIAYTPPANNNPEPASDNNTDLNDKKDKNVSTFFSTELYQADYFQNKNSKPANDGTKDQPLFLKNNPELSDLPELQLNIDNVKDVDRLDNSLALNRLLTSNELDTLESMFANNELWHDLDRANSDLETQLQEDRYLSQAVAASGLSVTAGVVSWMLRGGSLLASVMSTLPGWKGVDPLPIINGNKRSASSDANGQSKNDDKAEAIFDKNDKVEA